MVWSQYISNVPANKDLQYVTEKVDSKPAHALSDAFRIASGDMKNSMQSITALKVAAGGSHEGRAPLLNKTTSRQLTCMPN